MNDDAIIAALNSPLRRKILRHIFEKDGPAAPDHVAKELATSLNTVSYHVRVLRSAGALMLVDQQPVGGSLQNYYRPNPTVMGAPWVREVLGLPSVDR